MAASMFVLFVLCFSTIELLNAQAPLTCTSKVSQLQVEISRLANKSKLDVAVAVSVINNNIAIKRSTIKSAIADAKSKASTAIGPNANLCRNNLGMDLSAVNENGLNACNSYPEINLLKQQISQQLNGLKNSANLICQSCLDDACVDSQVDNVRQRAQDLQQGFSSKAASIQNNSEQCVESAGNAQLEVVRNASDNFDVCVGV